MTNHSSPVGQQCRLHAVKLTQQLLLLNIQKLEPRVIIRYISPTSMLTCEHCELYNYLCHLGCFQVFPDFVELVGVVGDPVHPPLHPQLPQLGDVLQHLVSSYLHCTYLHTAAPRCAVCGHVTGIFIQCPSPPVWRACAPVHSASATRPRIALRPAQMFQTLHNGKC